MYFCSQTTPENSSFLILQERNQVSPYASRSLRIPLHLKTNAGFHMRVHAHMESRIQFSYY